MRTDVTATGVPSGVWVRAVQLNLRAHQLGILPGDIIVELGGRDLTRIDDVGNHTLERYCTTLRSHPPGEVPLSITIMRPDTGEVCSGEIPGLSVEHTAPGISKMTCRSSEP